MSKAVQVLIGILIVLIIVVGVSLVLMPGEEKDARQVTGKAVAVKTAQDPIKIGVSLPFSGEAASYGQGIIGAIELAAEEVNADGGVNGRKIVLVKEDDQCTPNGGVAAMNKLVLIDKVDAVIGPLCSAAAGASLPIAQSASTPTIFFGSAPNLPKLGDYLFRTYPSDAFQGKYAAELIYNELGKKTVAVLYVQNDWGQGINDVFVKRFKELGGTVVFDEGVAQDTKDVRSSVAKIDAKSPEAIYLPVYPATGMNAVKQIREIGITVPIVGGDSFDGTEFIESGMTEDVIYTLADISNPDEFKQRVTAKTGKPTNSFTPLGYDALNIFADVMGKVGTDNAKVRDALSKLSYTKGITLPVISFDSDGDLASAEFTVKQVKNKKSVDWTG